MYVSERDCSERRCLASTSEAPCEIIRRALNERSEFSACYAEQHRYVKNQAKACPAGYIHAYSAEKE